MSDNLRRYRAIRDALTQHYPGQPTGTVASVLCRKVGHFANKIGRLAFKSPKEDSAKSVRRRKQSGIVGVYNTSHKLRYVSHSPKSRCCHKDWFLPRVREMD